MMSPQEELQDFLLAEFTERLALTVDICPEWIMDIVDCFTPAGQEGLLAATRAYIGESNN